MVATPHLPPTTAPTYPHPHFQGCTTRRTACPPPHPHPPPHLPGLGRAGPNCPLKRRAHYRACLLQFYRIARSAVVYTGCSPPRYPPSAWQKGVFTLRWHACDFGYSLWRCLFTLLCPPYLRLTPPRLFDAILVCTLTHVVLVDIATHTVGYVCRCDNQLSVATFIRRFSTAPLPLRTRGTAEERRGTYRTTLRKIIP